MTKQFLFAKLFMLSAENIEKTPRYITEEFLRLLFMCAWFYQIRNRFDYKVHT